MGTRITYFVHGTTTDNESDIATGWLPGELSDLGKRQSEELHAITKDKHFDAIFSSDLKRAIDSAAITFLGQNVISDKRLREANYGDLNGQTDSFKNNLVDYIDTPFPNGESYRDVEKRLNDFLGFIKKNYEDKHIAIVAHQAPQLALEVILKGKTWPQAINEDWRRTKSWQPGWDYMMK